MQRALLAVYPIKKLQVLVLDSEIQRGFFVGFLLGLVLL